MSNVVNMHGEPADITPPGTPDPDIVEQLEMMLELARSGEMNGLMVAWTYHDGATNGASKGYLSYSLVGRMEEVKMNLLDKLR